MSWTLEECFLLHVAAKERDPFPLVHKIQPQRLLHISMKEGMEGFVHRRLKESGFPPHFPEAVQKELEREYFRILARNMLLKKEGHRLLGLLSERGVPVLLIQGFPLLDALYEDYGLRPLSDIDFLLPSESFPKAIAVLRLQGFQSPPNFPSVFIKEDLQLDLHEDIMNVARIEGRKEFIHLKFEDLKKYAVELPEFQEVYQLRQEANFPLLAAHLVKHSFTRLIWFVDLLRILELEKARFNPREMAEIAERWNLLPSALIPVLFAKERFGCAVPDYLEDLMARTGLRKNFFARMVLNNHRSQGMGNYFVASRIVGLGDKLKFLWEFCFPKREAMAQMYPELEGRLALAYLYRFMGLALKTVKGILNIT